MSAGSRSGELHPRQRDIERGAKRLDRARLGQAGQALDQQVAVGEQADQQPAYQHRLPQHTLLDRRLQALDGATNFCTARRCHCFTCS